MFTPDPNDPQRHAVPAPPPSRPTHWLDTFFKYAAAVAVDHTHMPPLDRVSGRTGNVTSAQRRDLGGCG